jgi:hypothetical protein
MHKNNKINSNAAEIVSDGCLALDVGIKAVPNPIMFVLTPEHNDGLSIMYACHKSPRHPFEASNLL